MMGGIRGTYCDKCICHIANCSCDRRAPAEPAPASTGRVPDAWMVGIDVFKTRAQAERNVRDPDLAPIPLYRPVAARELDVEAERRRLTDEQIEEFCKSRGARWNGDYWIIEDADLHPLIRAARSAAQGTQPKSAPVSTEQAGDAWQPIETAPEDMKSRLYLVGGFCVQGFVDAGGVLNVQSEISPHWRKMRGKPTHWMPLPLAPSPNNSPVGADKEP